MLLPLPLHGMEAFISIVGAVGKIRKTLCNTEAVTLEPVKLLEALEQYVVLVSDIERRACHRHFRWSIGTSLFPHLPPSTSLFSFSLPAAKFFPQDSWLSLQLR
jgi:hypothetical protein